MGGCDLAVSPFFAHVPYIDPSENPEQATYLKASNTGSGDRFGWSVALSGGTLAVGAKDERSNATGVDGDQGNNSALNSGAVYVFTYAGGKRRYDAYLKASNTDANDRFGHSVALSGNTLAVGANQEDSNATGVDGDQTDNSALNSGAVYVFTRGGGKWIQQAYIKASNTGGGDPTTGLGGDRFGWSVALSGNTLAVGARDEDSNATGINGNQDDNSATDSGAVYVFTRDAGGTWTQQAYLKASDTQANDLFGGSVALSGDTLAVGAQSEDSGGVNSGAVYVFTRSGTTWTQQGPPLKASNAGSSDFFGSSVALSGDTLVVGAPFESSNAKGVDGDQGNNGATDSGAVYVFTRDAGGTWTQQAYLKASNTGRDDRFGVSVALSGDTLAVGANQEGSDATGVDGNQADNSAALSGAVYLFTRGGTTWRQSAYLKASNTNAQDQFGGSVALSGSTLAVGAIEEDSAATGINGKQDNGVGTRDSGAVYVRGIAR